MVSSLKNLARLVARLKSQVPLWILLSGTSRTQIINLFQNQTSIQVVLPTTPLENIVTRFINQEHHPVNAINFCKKVQTHSLLLLLTAMTLLLPSLHVNANPLLNLNHRLSNVLILFNPSPLSLLHHQKAQQHRSHLFPRFCRSLGQGHLHMSRFLPCRRDG
jgi:hypothetical protein